MGIICKGRLHAHYFNSKGNYTKVNGFARIYTLTAGRRTWPRRDREGRGQLERAAQGSHVLTSGSERLITDLCYTARAEGSGPCVLRGEGWRFLLFPKMSWLDIPALNSHQRLDTQPQKPLRYQLCTAGRCVEKFFTKAHPSKPLPLSLCPLCC